MDRNLHEGHRERLRSQYARCGADSFSDHQLVELLLTFTIPRKDTNELAHRLLDSFGSLDNIFFSDHYQLMTVAGIGESSACFLRLMGDVYRRIQIRTLEENGKFCVDKPIQSARLAFALLSKERYECVYLICLNKNHVAINTRRIASGTLTTTPIYPRLVAEAALASRAHSIILAHNHPSGDPSPSDEDREMTRQLGQTLNGLGIAVLDHVIVGRNSAYSLKADAIVLTRTDVYQAMRVKEFEPNAVYSAATGLTDDTAFDAFEQPY